MTWKEISTAPKDGTPIIGYAGGEYTVVEWFGSEVGVGYWSLSVTGTYAEDGEWWPTHWHQIPKGPKEES